ncbi:MAG TPA: hypothetical protein VFW02_08885, partial [Candidatus Limnocylindrales bacterium]|nr:hypothetical protein [Candidatus Limnocylindrales bacterium]
SGDEDPIVPVADGRRLAAAGPPGIDHWIVPGAGHRRAHRTDPAAYEARTTSHLRAAFLGVRKPDL